MIPDELVREVVPRIAQYSNTQNKINPADLTSNHEFHLFMEKASRRYAPPMIDGEVSGKWFYERARGSYKNEEYKRKTARDKNAFKLEYPRQKLLVKTDLAKYSLTFDCKPHLVCKGAANAYKAYGQKIFTSFEKDPDMFNEVYFKREVGKAILFRATDKDFIETQDWYKAERGYKAETVTYSLAYLKMVLGKKGMDIDFLRLWDLQGLPPDLAEILEGLTPSVRDFLTAPRANQQNVAEFAKKEACWEQLCDSQIPIDGDFSSFTTDETLEREKNQDAKKDKKIDNQILDEIVVRHPDVIGDLEKIIENARRLELLTPAAAKATSFIRNGNQNVWSTRAGRTPMRAFVRMLIELRELGHDYFPDQ